MELARYTLTEYSVLNTENLFHIVACAVIITIIRYILDFLLFKVSTCMVERGMCTLLDITWKVARDNSISYYKLSMQLVPISSFSKRIFSRDDDSIANLSILTLIF